MAKICYVKKNVGADRLAIIERAEAICEEYQAQGLRLTLRQCFYQFVARDLLPNKQSEYKRLGEILNDARMGGLLDWDFLVDRTRNLVSLPKWDSPAQLIRAVTKQYRTDLWAPQHQRVEVWIEKDAGIGVIEGVCEENHVPYFSCRGYTSVSEIWAASQRIFDYISLGEQVLILHIGDHDPSGLDMTRDITDRLKTFLTRDWMREHPGCRRPGGGTTVEDIKDDMRRHMGARGWDGTGSPWRVKRIALNQDQVERYSPPPNPAKTTDSRFEKYVEETGLDESWELDALDPVVLQDLIQTEIDGARDEGAWDEAEVAQEHERALLEAVSSHWSDVAATYAEET